MRMTTPAIVLSFPLVKRWLLFWSGGTLATYNHDRLTILSAMLNISNRRIASNNASLSEVPAQAPIRCRGLLSDNGSL